MLSMLAHAPLEVIDIQNVVGEVKQLELMPLPQQVHDDSTGEPETVSELHRVGYTGLDMTVTPTNTEGTRRGIRDRKTSNMELEMEYGTAISRHVLGWDMSCSTRVLKHQCMQYARMEHDTDNNSEDTTVNGTSYPTNSFLQAVVPVDLINGE